MNVTTSEKNNVFDSLDKIIRTVERYKKEPNFSEEVNRMINKKVDLHMSDNTLLNIIAELIAYSQGAKSERVEKMLKKGLLDRAFKNFGATKVSHMSLDEVIAHHWNDIKVIRFKKKVTAIIDCAKALSILKERHGSFCDALEQSGIPVRIKNNDDIGRFWTGFNEFKRIIIETGIPFLRNTTTLLHFLLDVGYDCCKPDLVVMKVAKDIGIVASANKDRDLCATVRKLQEYSLAKGIRSSVVDFYLLVYGGQTWAVQFVTKWPLPVKMA